MALKNYVIVILRGWWLVLPALLSALGVALILTYNQTPIYRTSATYVVSPIATLDGAGDVARGLDILTKRDSIMATYAAIATSRHIRNEIVKELNLTASQKENLAIRSEQIHPTNIIEITVESDDPDLAKTVAALVGEKTIAYVNNLYELYDIKPLDPPYTPPAPSKPSLAENLVLAVILGLLVGVALAFLAEYLRAPREVVASKIIDDATGVYNRAYFIQRLDQELSRAGRHSYPLSLAMMHIEQLDAIRQLRRPAPRREALRRVARYLTQHLRPEDLVACVQQDRFALLLPDTPGPDARQRLEELQNRLQEDTLELPQSGIKLRFSTSVGLAAYQNHLGCREFLARATEALEQAREGGYGQVCVFDQELHE